MEIQTTLPPDFQFLGEPTIVPDRFTPKYHIRYNDNGFSNPQINWNKRIKKLRNRRGIDLDILVPDSELEKIKNWPGAPNAIPSWIDEAFDSNLALFTKCGGTVAQKARNISPGRISKITIMSSIFQVQPPKDTRWTTGIYYPDTREIKVLNIYWWASQSWLKNARDLLVWEIGNLFSLECGIIPEDPNRPGGRPKNWPCL